MGKSKNLRRADERFLREFQRKRKIMKILVIVTAVLFVASLALVPNARTDLRWVVWAMLGVYIAAFIGLRFASACPYCKKAVMTRFEQQSHCPYCKRAIRPSR